MRYVCVIVCIWVYSFYIIFVCVERCDMWCFQMHEAYSLWWFHQDTPCLAFTCVYIDWWICNTCHNIKWHFHVFLNFCQMLSNMVHIVRTSCSVLLLAKTLKDLHFWLYMIRIAYRTQNSQNGATRSAAKMRIQNSFAHYAETFVIINHLFSLSTDTIIRFNATFTMPTSITTIVVPSQKHAQTMCMQNIHCTQNFNCLN